MFAKNQQAPSRAFVACKLVQSSQGAIKRGKPIDKNSRTWLQIFCKEKKIILEPLMQRRTPVVKAVVTMNRFYTSHYSTERPGLTSLAPGTLSFQLRYAYNVVISYSVSFLQRISHMAQDSTPLLKGVDVFYQPASMLCFAINALKLYDMPLKLASVGVGVVDVTKVSSKTSAKRSQTHPRNDTKIRTPGCNKDTWM